MATSEDERAEPSLELVQLGIEEVPPGPLQHRVLCTSPDPNAPTP